MLQVGSKGQNVRELQQNLINRGYNVGPYGADGVFGQSTYNAVVKFQKDNGLDADGIVGPATTEVINGSISNKILRKDDKGSDVKELQQNLINRGYNVGSYGADGIFGQSTYNAVVKFQKDNGLDTDGIVGPATWEALKVKNNYIPNVSENSGVANFLQIAISQIGYKEAGKNITKYGAWYGMQDEWCAMFVSWCANQAGILGSIVPKFAYCETGANWYRSKGRYRTRSSKYIPLPGDVIFFYNSKKTSTYYHTGIVEYTSGDRVYTIEGNTDNQVARRSYSLTDSNIGGYGADSNNR